MKRTSAQNLVSGLELPQQKRLNRYLKHLAKDRDAKGFDKDMYRELKVKSISRRLVEETKIYLDSIGFKQCKYEYRQILDQIERFAKPSAAYFGWNDNYRRAKERVENEFKSLNLKALHYLGNDDMMEVLPRKDTHAGFSFILSDKKYKGQYAEEIYQLYVEAEAKAREEGSFNRPILIGARTQCSGAFDENGKRTGKCRHKTRLVSIIDLLVIMAELKFSKPLQEWMNKQFWYQGGFDDPVTNAKIQQWTQRYQYWISLDYSTYDQTIPDWIIRDAFDIVKMAFSADGFDDELFTIVREDFINKVFLTPSGPIEVNKGVPSGSMFTQLLDTIVNRLMVETYLESKGYGEHEMMIMGDDNIVFLQSEIDADDVAGYLSRNFGVIVNGSKCTQGKCRVDHPKFLSRTWTPTGVYRDPQILIAKLLFPERYRDYEKYNFTPIQILKAYVDTYQLGMMKFINMEKLYRSVSQESSDADNRRWMSGLMAYRAIYLKC